MCDITYMKNQENGCIVSRFGSAVAVPTESGLHKYSPVVLTRAAYKPIKRVAKAVKAEHLTFWGIAPQGA